MSLVAIVSFRLGGPDGVSVEAAKWAWALGQLGHTTVTVAGEGPVDRLVPGLAIGAADPPSHRELDEALEGCDLVIVENLCSLPLNPGASRRVADVRRGRPTILHHHDLPWQRPHLAHIEGPPTDDAWRHVTINELSRRELAERGIHARTIYNTFDTSQRPGDRAGTRKRLGLDEQQRLVLQPTRALARKNIPGGLELAAALGATYWLLGRAEDGYGPELDRLLAETPCPVIRGSGAINDISDAYAAADVITLPSFWEGFGNPTIESVTYRRPLAIGRYPAARELLGFGFEFFDIAESWRLDEWLRRGDTSALERNLARADAHFSLALLPGRVRSVVDSLGEAVPSSNRPLDS